MRAAGRLIDQRRKGQEIIISIAVANKSTQSQLLKTEKIPTKVIKNRKGDTDIFFIPCMHMLSERRRPGKLSLSTL